MLWSVAARRLRRRPPFVANAPAFTVFSAAKASVSVSTSGFASTLVALAFVSRLVASATAESSALGSDFSSDLDSVFSSALGLATTTSSAFETVVATGLEDSGFASGLTDVFFSVFSAFASSDFTSSDLTSVGSDFTSSDLTSGVDVSDLTSEVSELAEVATSVDSSFNFSFSLLSTSSVFSAVFFATISAAFTAPPLAIMKLRVVPKKTDATPTLYFLKENRCCSLLIM